jgi:hypothetical protein
MTAIMKTREERREELKQLAAMPNGIDKLYLILTRNFIPFEKRNRSACLTGRSCWGSGFVG